MVDRVLLETGDDPHFADFGADNPSVIEAKNIASASKRFFREYVPSEKQIELLSSGIIDESFSGASGLEAKVVSNAGDTYHSTSGMRVDGDPLATIKGEVDLEFQLDNQSGAAQNGVSARWDYQHKDAEKLAPGSWGWQTTISDPNSDPWDIAFDDEQNWGGWADNDDNWAYGAFSFGDWTVEEHLSKSTVTTRSFDIAPDGNHLVWGDQAISGRVHEIGGSWSKVADLNSSGYSVEFSKDGTYVVACGGGVDNVNMSQHLTSDWSEDASTGISGNGNDASYSHDTTLIAHTEGSNVAIRNVSDLSKVTTLTDSGSTIYHISWAPNDEYLASAGLSDEVVYVYDPDDWSLVTKISSPNGAVTPVDFSPDGRWIAFGTEANVKIHRVGDEWAWKEAFHISGSSGFVRSVKFTDDSQYLGFGQNGAVRIYKHST